jgi:hypothetical protein
VETEAVNCSRGGAPSCPPPPSVGFVLAVALYAALRPVLRRRAASSAA